MSTISKTVLRVLTYFILITLAVAFLVPLWVIIGATLKSPTEFYQGPVFFIPEKIAFWLNWQLWLHGGLIVEDSKAIKETWVGLIAFGNSIFYGLAAGGGAIGIASLASYALSKIRFRGADLIFLLIVSMMFFPPQIFILPFIIMLKAFSLYNTRIGLVLIYIGLTTPFATFLLRNYFLTIHTEIIESARLDGASEARIWSRIVIPLAKPALAVCFIFIFNSILSDYLFAAALTTSESSRPVIPYVVDMMLAPIKGLQGQPPIGTLGALWITFPIVLVFILFQKYFIRGLLLGAVKK